MASEQLKAKTKLTDVYTDTGPLAYWKWSDSLKYGHSHDGLNEFSSKLLHSFIQARKARNEKTKIVDVGCSYGNSSLSLMDQMSWKQIGEFWANPSLQCQNKRHFDVTAVDLSAAALQYGQRRDYFDRTFAMNVNDEYSDALKQHIRSADILCAYMILCYFKKDSFQQLVDLFLSDRRKPKYIFYNFTPAFQENFGLLEWIPNVFIEKHPKCVVDVELSLHRMFTDEEKKNFAKKGNSLGDESLNVIFAVKCAPLQPMNKL
mmetsp:Transcript_28340/g.46571  ORF Transcript_28340/g.46571 Transcript_28340/m.46571 type:complete len:261 (-) Transcript_28340:78-860(-)